jgi:hypothetical protein
VADEFYSEKFKIHPSPLKSHLKYTKGKTRIILILFDRPFNKI